MKKCIITGLMFFLFISVRNYAQKNKSAEKPKFEMVQYYFVILNSGPNRTQSDSVAKKIQDGHMANINKMANEGTLLCAGPFTDNKGGGIFILKVKTEEEARKLVENDPAIKAGRLAFEIRPWMAAKGTFSKD